MPAASLKLAKNTTDSYTATFLHPAFEFAPKSPEEAAFSAHVTAWVQALQTAVAPMQINTDYRLSPVFLEGIASYSIARFADPRIKFLFGLGRDECLDTLGCIGNPRSDVGQPLPASVHDDYEVSDEMAERLGVVYDTFTKTEDFGTIIMENFFFKPAHMGPKKVTQSHRLGFKIVRTDVGAEPEEAQEKATPEKKATPEELITREELEEVHSYLNRLLYPISTVNNFPKLKTRSGKGACVYVDFHPSSLDAYTARALYRIVELVLKNGRPVRLICFYNTSNK